MSIRNWGEEDALHPSRPAARDLLLLAIYGCVYAACAGAWCAARLWRGICDPHGAMTLLLVVSAVVAGRVAR